MRLANLANVVYTRFTSNPERLPWRPSGVEYCPGFNYDPYLPAKEPAFYFRSPRHERQVVENLIWEARWRYYIMDAPVLSDGQYDALEHRLRVLYRGRTTPGSPLCTVGSSDPGSYPAHIQRYFRHDPNARRKRDK